MNKQIIIIISILCVVVTILCKSNIETFADTEAIQNVSSLYNTSQMSITNLTST